MNMKLFRVRLPLAHPFTISRGTITSQSSLIVELEHGGLSGFGEVTEDSYYGHTFDSMTRSLEDVRPLIGQYIDGNPRDLWARMHSAAGGDMFALSALDIAAHDYRGKRLGIPCWQDWGLEWNDVVPSSYTIGIDAIDKMIAKLNERPDWEIYKIKLGTDNDLEIVRQLRRVTGAVFRVDANCGWSTERAIENSNQLAQLGVQFIEQPLPVATPTGEKRRLFAESALPIIADEDCQVSADVAKCRGLYHGVNVKICKCGGLSPALTMLQHARQLGMKTMVGCMVESSIGISAAAQLLPLLDFADLDGAILLHDEPAKGIAIVNGRIARPEQPGCGTTLDRTQLQEFAAA